MKLMVLVVNSAINLHTLRAQARLLALSSKFWHFVASDRRAAMDRLDDTDERILAELTEHARATFAEIGARVNLSAPAVKRRVDRMLDNGLIRGFTTVIDRSALGWNTEAYVQVYCQGTIAPNQLRAAWI